MTIGTGYMTHKKTVKHDKDLAGYNETSIWSGRFFEERNKTIVLTANAKVDRYHNRGVYAIKAYDPETKWNSPEVAMKSFNEQKQQVINIPGVGDVLAKRGMRDDKPSIEFVLLPV